MSLHEAAGPLPADRPREELEVAVVGAGQAGLALGYHLARQGRRFAILERAAAVGAAWRERWDSLVLFTPRRLDALPGLPFPGDPWGDPDRDEVVDYLERYAEHFRLPVRLESEVLRLRRDGEGYALELADRTLHARQVVVATGPFQTPYTPPAAARLAPVVHQLHGTDYRRPQDVPGTRVVVVGGGNTGYQIAQELAATRTVHLAVGSRQTPLPARIAGRHLFWWLDRLHLLDVSVENRIGRRFSTRETLIGSSPRAIRRHGVDLRPRVTDVEGRKLIFADGSALEPDAVIWATGYRPDLSWIDLPLTDEQGRLRHRRGVTDHPGLLFLGLQWQHTRGSALLGWVADDAAFIAQQVAARAAAPA